MAQELISGFAPLHNHSSITNTSIDFGHTHQYLNITYPPTPINGSHIHYVEGYVLSENGHNHYYSAWSGPAIPLANSMHVHYYDFYTTEDQGHRHHVTGVDNPAKGVF